MPAFLQNILSFISFVKAVWSCSRRWWPQLVGSGDFLCECLLLNGVWQTQCLLGIDCRSCTK